MANSTHPTSPRSHGTHFQSSNLRNATETLSDAMPESMREPIREGAKASDIADHASEMATEFYENASTWLNSNYGRVITGVAIVSAIGVFGYFLGRSSRSNYLD